MKLLLVYSIHSTYWCKGCDAPAQAGRTGRRREKETGVPDRSLPAPHGDQTRHW